MKITIIDVGGLLSPLCARGVEKQLCVIPGVERADVNFVSGSGGESRYGSSTAPNRRPTMTSRE